MNKRFVAFLLLGILFLGAAEWDLQKRVFSPIRKLDRFWVDFCIGNARNRIGDPSITMVRITDDYEPVPIGIDEGGTPEEKPLTRLDYAAFLYAIGKSNPKTVSFLPAPVFAKESVFNQTAIYPLKDAALQLPRMTLGAVVSAEGVPANAGESMSYQAIQVKGDPAGIPAIAKTDIPADPDLLTNGDPAFIGSESFCPISGDSPRFQLVARQGDKVVAGFVLASVARQAGVGADQITLDLESAHPSITVGEYFKIPVAADGSMSLPSHGGLTHAMYKVTTGDDGKEKRNYQFASLKVEDVALAAERSDSIAQTILEEFSGKFDSLGSNLILLGFDRTKDRTIQTANEEWLSPMTATARAIATIQSGRHTTRWPLPIRGAVYGGIFLLALILFSLKRRTLPLVLGFGVLSVVALVLVFRQTLSWTPPTAIFGLFVLMFVIGMFRRPAKKVESAEPVTEPSVDPAAEPSADPA